MPAQPSTYPSNYAADNFGADNVGADNVGADNVGADNSTTDGNIAAEGGIEAEVDDADPQEIHVLHDLENPTIKVGAKFPDIIAFRKAIRHFVVKEGFEFAGLKTDKTRFLAHCAAKGCPWRIHASKVYGEKTIEIKVLPADHNCATTKLRVGKMASQGWCADRLGEWLKKNPKKRPVDAKQKLEEDYGIVLKYSKAWSGMKVALEQIHGKYEESFQLLFNWKAQLEICSPGSIVEIELQGKGKKQRFKRIFVALKPCINGFVAGCRPFIRVDATTLTGKYTGQLASATGVDGHNWLYYVAYAIFDAETDDNWTWFMQQLRRAVGSPSGLVICTDACKGLENAVGAVFPEAENRECMRHLYGNFMKYYSGDMFTDHLYPAARSYTEGLFKWHMQKIYDIAPDAIEYLQQYHSRLWYRCGFSEASKCDYLTNNVSENFNGQIKKFKGLLPHELVDAIREMIMEKRYLRRMVASKMESEEILPNVMKELNTISKNLKIVKVAVSDPAFAEVTLIDQWNNTRRHTVDLVNHKCSCREWQLTGKPCMHALAWILSNRGLEISAFVHEFYSVAKFRATYSGRVEAMPDRTQWPVVDLGFKVLPPLLGRGAGRPRKQKIRGSLEKNATKKKVRCRRCGEFSHFTNTCKLAMQGDGEDGQTSGKNKRKRPEEEAGPSTAAASKQKKKKPKPAKKKKSPKKKKTPVKKKLQKAASAPPASVVRSLKDWLGV